MEAGLDTGPVLLSEAIPIGPEDTTGDLHDRLSRMGARLIVRALAELDHLRPVPQSDAGVTYAEKIDKAEARIDWSRPSAGVDRQIRGLSPFPGAWFETGGERIKALRSHVAQGSGPAGTVLSGTTVACGAGAVELTEVQRSGKRPMKAEEFLRGMSLPDVLE